MFFTYLSNTIFNIFEIVWCATPHSVLLFNSFNTFQGSRISAALTMKKLLGDMSGVAPVATKRTDLTLPVDSAASKGMAKTDSPKSKSLAKAPFRPPTPFEELSAQVCLVLAGWGLVKKVILMYLLVMCSKRR